MTTGALATQGTKISAAMELTQLARNNPSAAPQGF